MLALIQRVTHAKVTINDSTYSAINNGLLILCGFEANDTPQSANKLLDKCFNYRIFSDQKDKMNLNLKAIHGEALIVPQFTLVADTDQGLRPSFSKGMPALQGHELFEEIKINAPKLYKKVCFGVFGADMQIDLCNDGPVTFMLSTNKNN